MVFALTALISCRQYLRGARSNSTRDQTAEGHLKACEGASLACLCPAARPRRSNRPPASVGDVLEWGGAFSPRSDHRLPIELQGGLGIVKTGIGSTSRVSVVAGVRLRQGPSVTPPSIATVALVLGGPESVRALC